VYKVHGFLDGKCIIKWRMEHLFRTGDTVRFAEAMYAKVTEVVWCMDEGTDEGQRVNVRMEKEATHEHK
jgi:hypothetical protein